jgi:hypothetical protein
MKRKARQIVRFLIAASVGFVLLIASQPGQSLRAATGDRLEPGTHPSATDTTGDIVFAKLVEFNRIRESRLQQYSVHTVYRVQNDKGETSAETRVVLSYRAPGTKEFKIVSEKGSRIVRSRVFKPLMDMEIETASVRYRPDSSITPNNYTFTLLGEEDVDGSHCFVVQATPKRLNKYLFKGKVWIHAEEFAVVKIAGQPAASPSVWVKRVDFVRRYQKIGEFWLPLKNESTTRVRLFGKNTLTTDYERYDITQPGVASR